MTIIGMMVFGMVIASFAIAGVYEIFEVRKQGKVDWDSPEVTKIGLFLFPVAFVLVALFCISLDKILGT